MLLYHGLTSIGVPNVPPREQKYWVTSARFLQHLDHIRGSRYQARLLDELWFSSGASDRRDRSVVITFDDGNASDYRFALPALVEREMRAEFFVNTATIGTAGFLDWREIREMHAGGMSFQSHSHDHVDLVQLPLQSLEHQLRDSKRMLEDQLGSPVNFLAPPYGRLNRQVIQVAREVGYRAVCTSWNWPARPGAVTVDRVAVYRHTGPDDLDRLLARDLAPYAARAARAAILFWPKRLLLRRPPSPQGIKALEKHA